MRELLLEIWTSVRRNKLRTFLTGFSVAWGIFMLVILLGSGNGLKNGATANMGNYATNSISIHGGWTSKTYMGYDKWRRIKLDNSDLSILHNEFPEVDEIAAAAWFNKHTATRGSFFTQVQLRGALPKLQSIEGTEIVLGRYINKADNEEYRKSIVIDQTLQTLLFQNNNPLGQMLLVGSSSFTVVGVYKGDAMRTNAVCIIPLTSGQLLYEANKPDLNEIVITVNGLSTDKQMEAFEQRIKQRLAIEHHYDPTDDSAIWIRNNIQMVKTFSLVFRGIELFIWIIGLGTLFAGVVGVSNIMLVTVTERTNEFGIRKALGAKPSSIIRLILTESVIITAFFGYIGMVLGVAVMEGVNYWLAHRPADPSSQFNVSIFENPTLDLGVTASATVVLVVAGLIAGYVPAYRAAQLKTIDALRHNK